MSGGSFLNPTFTGMWIVLVTLLWSAMGESFQWNPHLGAKTTNRWFSVSSYFIYPGRFPGNNRPNLLFTFCCCVFSPTDPCMCSGASPACFSTMCLFTDLPAARPFWQRRIVWKLGQGSVASGAEAAVSRGNPAWLMAASPLPHSAPLKLVRKTSRILRACQRVSKQSYSGFPCFAAGTPLIKTVP